MMKKKMMKIIINIIINDVIKVIYSLDNTINISYTFIDSITIL